MKRMVFVLVLGAGLSALDTSAQSLGEAAERAKREREARKGKASARTFTDDDLGRAGAGPAAASEPAAPAASPTPGEAGAKPEKSDDELRAEKRAQIQSQIDEHVRMMGVVRKAMADAQAELNDLSTLTFGSRRASLQKLIEDGEKELAKMRQQIADLVEDARRQRISVSAPSTP